MASDLSQLIQDGLCNTLNGLLAKDASLKETTKVHEQDLEELEVLKVNSVFDFEKLSSTLHFIIPAYSASYIFNTMMGETDIEPSLKIDDDTADAIGEFVSNTSGSLTTAINGSAFDDLGSVKFNIAKSDIIEGKSLSDIDKTYKFSINLEGIDIVIFIQFDDSLIPYIDTLTKYPVTFYEKKEEPAPEIPKEEPAPEIPKEEPAPQIPKEKPIDKKEDEKEEDKETDIKKVPKFSFEGKDKKIKLLIASLGSLLLLIIIAGITMYFMGIFDEPEPVVVKKDLNTTKKVPKDQVNVIKYTTLKKVNFKRSDINVNRLNGKLALLTKNNVLNTEELKSQKIKEKERLKNLDKEKEFIEFAKANKEEPLLEKETTQIEIIKDKKTDKNKTIMEQTQEIINDDNKEEIIQEKIQVLKEEPGEEIIEEEPVKDPKLKFILANSLKYKFFKEVLEKTNSKNARISICSDINGKTAIYIGPFENDQIQTNMNTLIAEQDATIESKIANITSEEFNTRCNF